MNELDLKACAAEPIHIPGSIQPHGALLGISEPDFRVVLSSANAKSWLGAKSDVNGRSLSDFFDPDTLSLIKEQSEGDPTGANPFDVTLSEGKPVHGLLHRSEGFLVLEIESAKGDRLGFETGYRRLVRRFDRLKRANTLDEVQRIAAHEIRCLTGFDRVMIYRFDSRANGQVVAEERADETLSTYLHLHYPASDIPSQARQLYLANPVRIIVDAHYKPVPLVPELNPLTGSPLDLSNTMLRSVSPIHCEYLRNMGVRASMSISILVDEKLWGLVACHHRTPFHLPFATRLVCEFLSHVMSSRIADLERLETLSAKSAAYSIQSQLIDQMVGSSTFAKGLEEGKRTLADLIPCDGAAVVYRSEVTRIGTTPSPNAIQRLGRILARQRPKEVVVEDRIGNIDERSRDYLDTAAGCIAVPISADGNDFLFWFRRERIRTVTWAGDPRKPAHQHDESPALSPRKSFEAWSEEVRGSSLPWSEWEVEIAADFRTALVASVVHQAAELERLNLSLLEASEQKDRFLATVSHELRTPLSAIVGWVQIARAGVSGDDIDRALETIERNAKNQARLIEDLLDISRIEGGRLTLEVAPVDLVSIVESSIETLEPSARSKNVTILMTKTTNRIDIVADPGRIRQVVWNLLSNSIKFSRTGGRVRTRLDRDGSSATIEVIDEGDGIPSDTLPHIFEPFRQAAGKHQRSGLGLGLSIVKSIVELHDGTVDAFSDGLGRGATFRVVLPVSAIRATNEIERKTDRSSPSSPPLLNGLTILIVEDHRDSADILQRLLTSVGARVDVSEDGRAAIAALEETTFDIVVSDLEMPEMDGWELIKAIRDDPRWSHLPVIALTSSVRGSDRVRALRGGFDQHVPKPVEPDELIAVISRLMIRL